LDILHSAWAWYVRSDSLVYVPYPYSPSFPWAMLLAHCLPPNLQRLHIQPKWHILLVELVLFHREKGPTRAIHELTRE
jgi:hypothetical protein